MHGVWPQLAAMHLNTVLVPVAWETIEPKEGTFDFAAVDGLLQGARANHLKLVVLWFGSWKNTFSSYTPAWVKQDTSRFPRVQSSAGQDTERLSPFSAAARDADADAFARLMQHVREVDGTEHTVLMVQVENEVGVIPEARDYSPVANRAFSSAVPPALLTYLAAHRSSLDPGLRAAWESAGAKTSGTWQEVFGAGSLTADLFMAWQYATYIERVARAGKGQYAIPMYTNAALIRPNYEPGQYNSGGPLPHSIDLWHAGAPSLDFLSPDIYFNDFAQWARSYTRADNPLFIPEAQGGSAGSANALYAFGQLKAIGFSVFGIDDQGNLPLDLAGITNPADRVDNSALARVYNELSHLEDPILSGQQSGGVYATLLEGEAQRSARVEIGSYTATLTRSRSPNGGARLGALFLQTGVDEFLVVGSGEGQIGFSSSSPALPLVGIESIDEEVLTDGSWAIRRRLNGDESSQGQELKLSASDPGKSVIYRVRLYRYR